MERVTAAPPPKSPWRGVYRESDSYLKPIRRAAEDDGKLYTHRLFSAAVDFPGHTMKEPSIFLPLMELFHRV